MVSPDDEGIAFHEAGHAVAAYLLQAPIAEVSIVPDGDTAGRCVARRVIGVAPGTTLRNILRDDRAAAERSAMIAMAGRAADALYLKLDTQSGDVLPLDTLMRNVGDINYALDLFLALSGSEDTARRYVAVLALRVEALLKVAPNWAAVESLARVLLVSRSVGGGRALAVIMRAIAGRSGS